MFSLLTKNDKIKTKDLILFFKQMSTLFKSGIPIVEIFNLLETTQQTQSSRLLAYRIKKNLKRGMTLYKSISQHQHIIDQFICHLLKIGETTGSLDIILEKISLYLEKNYNFRRNIVSALVYPTIITLFSTFILIIFFLCVVPRFKTMLLTLPGEIPYPTQICFLIADYFPLILFIASSIIFIIFFTYHPINAYLKKYNIDLCQFWFANLFHLINSLNFARELSIALNAGINLTQAITLIEQKGQNLRPLLHAIENGCTLYEAMNKLAYFPPLMVQMIKIAEASGNLSQILDQVSALFEDEIETKLTRLAKLLEPTIMLIVGIVIGTLVIVLYLPIFNLSAGI